MSAFQNTTARGGALQIAVPTQWPAVPVPGCCVASRSPAVGCGIAWRHRMRCRGSDWLNCAVDSSQTIRRSSMRMGKHEALGIALGALFAVSISIAMAPDGT